MQIKPLTSARLYTNSQKQSTPIKPFQPLKSDTVSFGATKSYTEQMLDELEMKFDEKIQPFINQYLPTYKEIGAIVAKSLEITNATNECSTQYTHDLIDMYHLANYSHLKNSKKYLDRADSYDKNVSIFNKIKDLAELPMYRSSKELVKEIKKSEKFFDVTEETEKLLVIRNMLKNTVSETERTLYQKDFSKSYPELYEKIKAANETKNNALSWLILMPVQDALDLKKQINESKANINNPKKNWYEETKIIEKMFTKEKGIISVIHCFDSYEQELQSFLTSQKNAQNNLPSIAEIKESFAALTKANKKVFNDNFSHLNKELTENHIKNINLKKADAELKKQTQTINRLNKIIDEIKTKYYEEQNKKFIKENY